MLFVKVVIFIQEQLWVLFNCIFSYLIEINWKKKGMYPKIQEEVKKGNVLLEWDSSKGKAPVPLLKDVYASERRKAKTLNFSIAYGKTAIGLIIE